MQCCLFDCFCFGGFFDTILKYIAHIASKSTVTLCFPLYTYPIFNVLQDLVYVGNISLEITLN